MTMAFTAPVAEPIQLALAAADRDETPFTHWTLTEVLPPGLYAQLRDLRLGPPPPAEGAGRRETHNAQRLFLNPAARARFPQAEALAAAFQAPRTISVLERLTGAELDGTYLRIEYCLDVDGFWLEPHTDIAAKRFTMLVYLSDCPGCEAWGTDLLDAEGRLVLRPLAHPNSAVIFIPSGESWHGFERRPIEGVRRTLIINYVAPDWRARHELSDPDHPVRRAEI